MKELFYTFYQINQFSLLNRREMEAAHTGVKRDLAWTASSHLSLQDN